MAWNARRGDAWADLQPLLDRLFSSFEGVLMNAVLTGGVRDVLDVGCGTGATTLAFGTRLAAHGTCTGIDILASMLGVARSRATATGLANVRFVEGDAQCFDFPHHAFDAVTSRFGVMLFKDPELAFANIRRAVRPTGTLTCVVCGSGTDNPFMIAAERATASLLGWPDPTRRRPDSLPSPMPPTSIASSAPPDGVRLRSARSTFRAACPRPILPLMHAAWEGSA